MPPKENITINIQNIIKSKSVDLLEGFSREYKLSDYDTDECRFISTLIQVDTDKKTFKQLFNILANNGCIETYTYNRYSTTFNSPLFECIEKHNKNFQTKILLKHGCKLPLWYTVGKRRNVHLIDVMYGCEILDFNIIDQTDPKVILITKFCQFNKEFLLSYVKNCSISKDITGAIILCIMLNREDCYDILIERYFSNKCKSYNQDEPWFSTYSYTYYAILKLVEDDATAISLIDKLFETYYDNPYCTLDGIRFYPSITTKLEKKDRHSKIDYYVKMYMDPIMLALVENRFEIAKHLTDKEYEMFKYYTHGLYTKSTLYQLLLIEGNLDVIKFAIEEHELDPNDCYDDTDRTYEYGFLDLEEQISYRIFNKFVKDCNDFEYDHPDSKDKIKLMLKYVNKLTWISL